MAEIIEPFSYVKFVHPVTAEVTFIAVNRDKNLPVNKRVWNTVQTRLGHAIDTGHRNENRTEINRRLKSAWNEVSAGNWFRAADIGLAAAADGGSVNHNRIRSLFKFLHVAIENYNEYIPIPDILSANTRDGHIFALVRSQQQA